MSAEAKTELLEMMNRYVTYGWTRRAICKKWNISPSRFYDSDDSHSRDISLRPTQLNTITLPEKLAVRRYALEHTELRHREMAYRMIDENVAFLSPSSVYRILKEYKLIRSRNEKNESPEWQPHKQATGPDQIWMTDLMYLKFKGREYYLLSYMDIYSRYIVYQKLCYSMTGTTIQEATEEAFRITGKRPRVIQSDNGSCYISQEYRSYVDRMDIKHRFIHPHCPNENAEIERYHRTVRELVDPSDAENFTELLQIIKEQKNYYNDVRYHSKIGFIPPAVKYTGDPNIIFEERKQKLERAKAQRIKYNYEKVSLIIRLIQSHSISALN